MTFSLSPASATETFTVEQGWKPLESAAFWLTMVRMRPGGGIHHNHRAVILAQRFHGSAPYVQIFAIDACRPASNRHMWARTTVLRG